MAVDSLIVVPGGVALRPFSRNGVLIRAACIVLTFLAWQYSELLFRLWPWSEYCCRIAAAVLLINMMACYLHWLKHALHWYLITLARLSLTKNSEWLDRRRPLVNKEKAHNDHNDERTDVFLATLMASKSKTEGKRRGDGKSCWQKHTSFGHTRQKLAR